jgi:hypothetical protein
MAATVTARSTAPARRAPARRAPSRRAPARRAPTRRSPARAGFVPVAAAAGAVGGIADSGLFVWLTRGRLWIGLLGTLLVGIVGLNVMALSFSASSSNAGQAADSLRRMNSAARANLAGKLTNSEIQAAAAKFGLVMPPAGDIRYMNSSANDAKTAAQRIRDGELTAGSAAAPVVPAETAPVTTAPVEDATATTDPSVAAADPAVAVTDPATDPATSDPATTAPAETVTPPAEATSTAGGVGVP